MCKTLVPKSIYNCADCTTPHNIQVDSDRLGLVMWVTVRKVHGLLHCVQFYTKVHTHLDFCNDTVSDQLFHRASSEALCGRDAYYSKSANKLALFHDAICLTTASHY